MTTLAEMLDKNQRVELTGTITVESLDNAMYLTFADGSFVEFSADKTAKGTACVKMAAYNLDLRR